MCTAKPVILGIKVHYFEEVLHPSFSFLCSQTFAFSTQTLNSSPKQDVQAQGRASACKQRREGSETATNIPFHTCTRSLQFPPGHRWLSGSLSPSVNEKGHLFPEAENFWCSGEVLSRCSGLLLGGLGSGIAHCSCSELCSMHSKSPAQALLGH